MKTTLRAALGVAAMLSVSAYAQQVPAFSADLVPPGFQTGPVSLNAKERAAIRLANEWKDRRDMPRRGPDGSVRYLFGATLPTVVCAPLQICNLHLQEGENVTDIHAGDSVRWKIKPAAQGSDANRRWVAVIKPTDANLSTSLTILTDRRTYSVKLVSHQREWMPNVSFDYPEDLQAAWSSVTGAQARESEARVMPDGTDIASLDFGFRLSGASPSWRPLRVYTDGVKTYIQFPSTMQEAPALVSLGSGSEAQLVNYRMVGDRFVVDKVLERAALISGVGRDQTKVEIIRTRGQK